ncbi:hypothetical protein J2847_005023 [Azospirillum agricola]|uniref:hypothetical protein n=1 Tax=Azospirillum agricola TaxID=1720247 RepID=UPI001AE7204C|nr:hypothetical protein [Azospirillum agricola]MBP2231704.1 hypothetical protein [Azospirillum agricola]
MTHPPIFHDQVTDSITQVNIKRPDGTFMTPEEIMKANSASTQTVTHVPFAQIAPKISEKHQETAASDPTTIMDLIAKL